MLALFGGVRLRTGRRQAPCALEIAIVGHQGEDRCMYCPRCGVRAPEESRFCASCGAPLPAGDARSRGPKITRLYLGIQTSDGDPPGPVLRVSRYLEDHEFSAPEGTTTVPGDHARISIWNIDRPVAAISLTGSDAEELGRFLSDPEPSVWPRDEAEQDLST